MGDHKYFYDDLQEIVQELNGDVEAINSSRGGNKQDKIQQANDKMKRAKKVLHQLKIELRSVDNPDEKRDYDKKVAALDKEIRTIQQAITQAKTEAAAVAAQGGGGGDEEDSASPKRDDGKKVARKLAGGIETTQKDSLASLERSKKLVQDSEETARESEETLAKQTEDLVRIKEDLSTLRGNLDRAKREMNAFVRRMMSDKLILLGLFLVLVGLLVLIILKVVNKFKKGNDSPPPLPPPPAGPTPNPNPPSAPPPTL